MRRGLGGLILSVLLGMGCSFFVAQEPVAPVEKPVVVWQPSHQNHRSGDVVNEALV